MSSLWIIVGLAIVLVLALLDELEVRVRLFEPQNLWEPSPEGSWTEVEQTPEVGFWLEIFFVMLFVWLLTNTPLLGLSVTYLVLIIFYTSTWGAEIIDKRSKFIAIIGPGRLEKWPGWAGTGILIGIIFGLVANSLGQISAGQAVQFAELPFWAAWLMTGFAIPAVEEETIRGILLPSAAEDVGIIAALLVSSGFFAVLHWTLFGPQMFLIAFVFSLIAGVLTLRTRSIVPAVFMHIAYNTVVLIVVRGILEGVL